MDYSLPRDHPLLDMCRTNGLEAATIEVGKMLSDTSEGRSMFRAEEKGEYAPRPWV